MVSKEAAGDAVRFNSIRNGVTHYYAMLRGEKAKVYECCAPVLEKADVDEQLDALSCLVEQFATKEEIEAFEEDASDIRSYCEEFIAPIGTIAFLFTTKGAEAFFEPSGQSNAFDLEDMKELVELVSAISAFKNS
jgi:hypothetical protein